MNLVRLALINFRQHVESVVAFEMGTCAILGANGSGKTTLVEAISFALYGSKTLRGKLDEVRTRGAGKEKKDTSVELSFSHDGRIYRIVRTLSSSELYGGGEAQPIVRGPREVTAFVTALLGMNQEEFMATYFTEQKGLEFLSGQKGAAERERFILRMLGYDRFEKLQELLRADRKDLRTDLQAREAASGNKEEIEKRLELERAEVETLTKKLSEATSALQQNEEELEKVRKTFERVEKTRAEWVKGRSVLTDLEGRLNEKSKQLAKFDEWSRIEKEKLLSELKSAGFTSVEQLEPEKIKAEQQVRELEEREANKKVEFTELEKKRTQLGLEIEAEFLSATRAYQDAVQHLKKLERMDKEAPCPTCGQELGGAFHGHRDSLEAERATKGRLLEAAKERSEAHKKEAPELEKLKGELKTLADLLSRSRLLIATLERHISKLTLIQNQEESQREAKGEAAALELRVREQQELLKGFQFSEEDYLKLKGNFEARSGLANVSRLQRVKIEGELSSKQGLARRSEEELRSWEERHQAATELKKKLLLFEEADLTLTEFRKNVNASVRPRLAELASEFIAELTDGRYTSVEVSMDFSPTVLEDGLPKSVISGGEEDILNLCVRLALSQMLAERSGHEISLLILDEVFGSLDQQRRENLLALLERLNSRFEQILIITHLEDVKDGVRNILVVDYDENTGTLTVNRDQGDELEAIGI